MNETKEKATIIEILQKMVRENAPEETIVTTLLDLGVSREQAERLLLVAQADTFTLLSSELNKIVQKHVSKEQKQMEESTKKFVDQVLEEKKKQVKMELEKEFLTYKIALSKSQASFQDAVNESISRVARLNEEVNLIASENKKMIGEVQRDLSETKLRGIKMRRSIARNSLTACGLLCFVVSIIVIAYTLLNKFNLDFVTGAVAFIFVGSILIYLSTNI